MTDQENNAMQAYSPCTYKIPQSKTDIFDHAEKPEFSKDIDYPKFSLGFQHFIHQSKTKMEITKEFKDKKKVYYIISQFERNVDDYENDINNISRVYFDIDPKPNILSRAFYKLWELFFMFDIIDLNESEFVSAHLAEGPGSFIQATMFYRDKFAKKGLSKNDKYYAVTLHPSEGVDHHIPKLEDKFVDYYKKEKPLRFVLHKTYSTQEAGASKKKDNGDLTDPKTMRIFGGNFTKKKANLITADGGFEWNNENIQEQEAFKLILAQIIMALKIQEKGGNFVCKIYESFTKTTSKCISILTSFYKTINVTKPLMSRASNSEKYIICMDFIDNKDNDKRIKKLDNILDQMNENKGLSIVDIFPEFQTNDEFKSTLIKLNSCIENRQFIDINRMIVFINKQNFRGDEYTQRRQMQIDATKYWLDTFFPEPKDFENKKSKLMKQTQKLIEDNHKEVESLQKKLEF